MAIIHDLPSPISTPKSTLSVRKKTWNGRELPGYAAENTRISGLSSALSGQCRPAITAPFLDPLAATVCTSMADWLSPKAALIVRASVTAEIFA